RRRIVQMLASMADRDSVSAGLLALPEVFLEFGRAGGAAIVTAEDCELVGDTPPASMVVALSRWLGQQGGRELFSSENVSRDVIELPELGQHVAGLLALSISELHEHYLIWFRPEQVRTVTWAGKPEKRIDERGALHPRHSFQAWGETVSGFAVPWDRVE